MDVDSETGTLVVVIPTAEGLVVAADSRGVVRGHFIDSRRKLHVANTKQPVVFALPGTADFPKACPPGAAITEWMTNPPYAFRASDSVLVHLQRDPTFILTEPALYAAAAELSEAFSAFLGKFPQKLHEYQGSKICTLVMCQTENPKNTTCGSVSVSVDAHGGFVLSKLILRRYRSSEEKVVQLFGESQYAQDVVLGRICARRGIARTRIHGWRQFRDHATAEVVALLRKDEQLRGSGYVFL